MFDPSVLYRQGGCSFRFGGFNCTDLGLARQVAEVWGARRILTQIEGSANNIALLEALFAIVSMDMNCR